MTPSRSQQSRESVQMVDGSPYEGRRLRSALAQLQADLGSATFAIEEARQSGEATTDDLERLRLAHKHVVHALGHTDIVRDQHGFPDPDAPTALTGKQQR